jgi:hypothetical protein
MMFIYLVVLAAAGIQLGFGQRKPSLIPGSILAFATMHMAWGAGFWASLLRGGRKRSG